MNMYEPLSAVMVGRGYFLLFVSNYSQLAL
nr:MAG TPA: hypothetical protein [Caudoviricetes sp.]